MLYRYASPTQHRLVFDPDEGTSLALPVAPWAFELITELSTRHPAWVLTTLLAALDTALPILEQQAAMDERAAPTGATQTPLLEL